MSGANATFDRSFGTGAGNVNWTSNAGFAAASNAGSGGFSAYAGAGNGNGNTLTVNLNGGGTLFWNDQASAGAQLFVADGHALKFGSVKSNATVNFTNNIALDGSSATEGLNASNTVTFNRTREFNVTRGVGNDADKTIISGIISGTANSDLVKTGTGVLELSAQNTYQGNTYVQGGMLRVTNSLGSGTGTGQVIVGNSASLEGTGIISGQVTVAAGGTIRGGDSSTVGTLTLGNGLALSSNSTLAVLIKTSTGSSAGTNTGGSTLGTLPNPTNNSFLNITGGTTSIDSGTLVSIDGSGLTFTTGQSYSYTVATYTGTHTAVTISNQSQFSTSNFTNASDFTFSLADNGAGFVYLNFTPVPEPATVLGIAVAAMGVGGFVRRRFRKDSETTTAA